MRVMTIKELIIEELNKQLAKDGIQVVGERPAPQLATSDGEVIPLNRTERQDGYNV